MPRSKTPTFDDFWKAYPLHMGKRDAERAWKRLSAGDKQKALAGVSIYRKYIEQTGVNIKYPQGWLNGHRWEDKYDEVQQPEKQPDPEPTSIDNDMKIW